VAGAPLPAGAGEDAVAQPARTTLRGTIGRPIARSTPDSTALACLCLVLALAGLAVLHSSIWSEPTRDSTLRGLTAALVGPGATKRPRSGAGADAPSRPAPAATTSGASTAEPAAGADRPAAEAPPAADLPVGGQARVANTDNLGVVLRTAPRPDARVPRGLMEGAAVTLVERAGDEWAHVRAANGQQGWVPLRYLAPAD
jgi:uncharacterized protein YgiM (DUF1202 family)